MNYVMKFMIMAIAFFTYSFADIGGNNNNVGKFLTKNNLSRADEKLATYLLEMYNETRDAEHLFLLHFENSQKMFNEIKKENIASSSFRSQLKPEKEEKEIEEKEKEEKEKEEKTTISNETTENEVTENATKSKPSPSSFRTSSSGSLDSSASTPSTSSPSHVPRFIQTKAKGPVEEEAIWRAIYATQLRRTPPTANVNVYSEENIKEEFEKAQMDAYISEIERMKNQFEKNLNYMSTELERQKKIKDTLKQVFLLEEEIKNLEKNKKITKGGPIIRGAANATKVIC